MIMTEEQKQMLEGVFNCAAKQEVSVYLVGGVVRDLFLHGRIQDRDLDFIVEGDAERLARRCSTMFGGEVKTFPNFLTAKIVHPTNFATIFEIDFAQARTEWYPSPGSLPQVSPAPLKEDLRRRDFTINAVALAVRAVLEYSPELGGIEKLEHCSHDLFGGLQDLHFRSIKVLHENSFTDDPTRLFRAIRYVTRLNGVLEPETGRLFRQAIEEGVITSVSYFRQIAELRKMCSEVRWVETLAAAQRGGLLQSIELFPAQHEPSAELESVHQLGAVAVQARFALLMFLVYLIKPPSKRDQFFRGLGYGKRLLATLRKGEEALCARAPAHEFTDEALLVACIRFPEKVEYREEAGRRGVLIA